MSQTTLDGFNKIASVYDVLAQFVYGKSIRKAQTYYLSLIKNSRRILVLGGGSGWIVEEMCKQTAAEITYIEASSTMIALTKQRNIPISRTKFIHGTEYQIPEGILFDAVITNFYLDVFREEKQQEVIKKIQDALSTNGLWLVSDFVDSGKVWHRFLLITMHQFFRRFGKIEARTLADWEAALRKNGLTQTQSKSFYNGFIKSAVFVKGNTHTHYS